MAVVFTRFESRAPLSKRFDLADGGGIVKTPAANMTTGRAQRVALDFAEFGAALGKAGERVAFGYGLHDSAAHGVAVKIAVAAKADPTKHVLARTREFFDYRPEPGVLMLDHDPHPDGAAASPEQLRGILAAVCPAFGGAACWVRGSLSAGVHVEGEAPKAGRGFHLYFAVHDAADIPRFGKALVDRLWLAGHGFIALSSAGSFLVRGLVDSAVFDGERLGFVGKPVIGPGLAYTAPQAVYHPGGGLDTRALPDLGEAEARKLKALVAQAKQAREADRQAQRAAWEAAHVRAQAGRGVPEDQARAQVRRIPADGKPADLYRDWPLEFATLGFATVGDVLKDPARYDGQALADPIEGVKYGRTTAKFYVNRGGKPYINSHAHGGCKYFLKASAGPKPGREPTPEEPGHPAQPAEPGGAKGAGTDQEPGDIQRTKPARKAAKAAAQPTAQPYPAPTTAPQPATQGTGQPQAPAKAGREDAMRGAFERKIGNTEDFGALVYQIAPDINKSSLRNAAKTYLLKQIAKKTGVSVDIIRQDLQDHGDAPEGRGRADAGFLPYEIKGNQIWLIDNQGRRPLCNFAACVKEEVIHDDGATAETLFLIEGCMNDGTHLRPLEVPASRFPGMGWVSEWGARPLVHAGSAIKDHLRAAIQGIVPCDKRRTVYGHTGWRKLGEAWRYLHSGGAVGATQDLAELEVRAGEGNMRRYAFSPDGGGDMGADIRASLRLLDISASNPALGVVLLAAAYRAPLGEAAAVDFGVFLAGQTGSRKSEAAAIALAHYGRGFSARHFPANWDDTDADIEAKAHAAKDALFVVDDFKPRGSTNDVHKLHVKADRVFRSVGNQSGRGRRTADMRQRAAFHPRGLVLATGEDLPRGASLRARLAVVELAGGDVDNAILSELQASARAGALERAMAGFLRWLAGSLDDWKVKLPDGLRGLRDDAIQEGFATSHARAADIYASLLVGVSLFLKCAEETGAIDANRQDALLAHAQQTLKQPEFGIR